MSIKTSSVAHAGEGPLTALPKVWLVMSYRAGENSQIDALAKALGWPYEKKRIRHRRWEFITNLGRGTSLNGIVIKDSSALCPPWPDLVISAGMRNEPVCRWIRRQSSNKTRIVHIGRPWARPENFDLIITTPQYRLAEHPRVLQNDLVLHGDVEAEAGKNMDAWRDRLAHLPRPWFAVLIGGNTGPYTIGEYTARRLAAEASAFAEQAGGSLLVTTSSRTPASVVGVLKDALLAPNFLYAWKDGDAANPYAAFLSLSDEMIVSGESIAMLSEACATLKPVYIFEFGSGAVSMKRQAGAGTGSWQARHEVENDSRISAFLYAQLMRIGPRRLTRDISLVHRALVESGRAVWFGEEFPRERQLQPLQDVDRAVQRVRALFPGV